MQDITPSPKKPRKLKPRAKVPRVKAQTGAATVKKNWTNSDIDQSYTKV